MTAGVCDLKTSPCPMVLVCPTCPTRMARTHTAPNAAVTTRRACQAIVRCSEVHACNFRGGHCMRKEAWRRRVMTRPIMPHADLLAQQRARAG